MKYDIGLKGFLIKYEKYGTQYIYFDFIIKVLKNYKIIFLPMTITMLDVSVTIGPGVLQ